VTRSSTATPLVAAADTDGRQVLDIRRRSECASGHVPGALHVAITAVAAITAASGLDVTVRLTETHPRSARNAATTATVI